MTVLADVMACLAIFGNLSCIAGLCAVLRFATRPQPLAPRFRPAITILKPLCGEEPELEEALASCCAQIYPTFQIVFGVHSSADPALAIVQRLLPRFPGCDISVVVDPALHGLNRKVSNLINMLPSARHDMLVISDSDLHVPPDYLDRLVAEMEKPGTGLVTCASFGRAPAASGWPTKLNATQMTYTYLPGVLLSRILGREDCLGSTTMVSRENLGRSGGLGRLANVLAEDNVMGISIRELGFSIGLAGTLVAATVFQPGLGALWRHELRWARTFRATVPFMHGATAVQYPMFWAMLACVFSGAQSWSIGLFALSWLVRAASMMGIDAALKRKVGRLAGAGHAWLLPFRDLLSVIEIAASYCIEDVVWRGHVINAKGTATSRTTPANGPQSRGAG